MDRRRTPLRFAALLTIASACAVSGCGKPNAANILLRKEIQNLQGQVAQLKRQHGADQATIAGLAERSGGTTQSLPPTRLDRLFTVHSIRLGRLTGGADLDREKPGDDGLKIHVELLDQHSDTIKSSGSFVVDAFDLSEGEGGLRIGHWEFPVEKSQANWHSFLMRYEYVLPCPWQERIPRHPDVTVKVVFNDELTGRQFTVQKAVKVNLVNPQPSPPAKAATQPAANLR